VRAAGGSPRVWPPKPATSVGVSTDSGSAKPATSVGVSTDSGSAKPATSAAVSTDSGAAKPATSAGVSTDSGAVLVTPQPGRAPSASACEPYREVIEEAAARGRNAMAIWQDLVDDHGFRGKYASVKRLMARLRRSTELVTYMNHVGYKTTLAEANAITKELAADPAAPTKLHELDSTLRALLPLLKKLQQEKEENGGAG
jgi:hypothetical protein